MLPLPLSPPNEAELNPQPPTVHNYYEQHAQTIVKLIKLTQTHAVILQ